MLGFASGTARAPVTAMAPGRGARSFLFSAGPVVLKLRAQSGASCEREVFGLRALPPTLGPALLAHATPAALLEAAARARRFDALVDLDVPVGELLVLERLTGSAPRSVSPACLVATAAALRVLHGRRPRRGPALAVPGDPSRLLAFARERAAALHAERALDAPTRARVERALALAARHVDACWRRGLRPAARVLCHGDLRWHNLAWDEASVRVRFLDLEHAGIGDPCLDLAMFSARAPLSQHQELMLLDAYLRGATIARSRAFIDRFFAQRPLVALGGALDGALELVLFARGQRAGARAAEDHWQLRRDEVQAELARALDGIAPRGTSTARLVRTTPPERRRRSSAKPTPKPKVQVAIDGHAAAGKSQIARDLAELLGVPWVNTGVAYRYAALTALRLELAPRRAGDVGKLTRALARARLRLDDNGGLEVVERSRARRLCACLGVLAIDRTVAQWAALLEVRQALAPVIAAALRGGRGVVEGRDVGTVLLPQARHKLFITASLAQRAAFVADKEGRDRTDARALVSTRDRRDQQRALAPLLVAPGARVLDTTGLTRARALTRALALLGLGARARLGADT